MDTWTLAWWLWLLLGMVLAGLELVTPGLYLLFFGVAAALVGVLSAVGLVQQLWLQVLLFTVLGLLTLGLFRRGLLMRLRRGSSESAVDALVGETALVMESLPANGFGKVELRGTAWQARNLGTLELLKGQNAIVEQVDGLMLCVRGSEARASTQSESPRSAGEEG